MLENQIKPKNEKFIAQATAGEKFFIYLSMILIIPIFWYIGKKNWFNRTIQKIEETASGIDIQLKKRKDLLIKLLDAAKGYMKFEKETLNQITSMRSQNVNNIKDMAQANMQMDQVQRAINVQIENYPDLKAITAVRELQKSAQDCEDNIAAARRFFNYEVRIYNQNLRTYPSNVIASKMGLESEFYFEATIEEREDVKINFD